MRTKKLVFNKVKLILAGLLAAACATPAMAVDFKVSGDFNNRFSYSTQADLGTGAGSDDPLTYINVNMDKYKNGDYGFDLDTKKNSKDSDYFGELKYRLTMTATDDEQKVKAVLGIEAGGIKFGSSKADFGGDAKGSDSVFEFRYGYIDFEAPFDANSHISIGLQPVGYNFWLWGDNAAGVKWTSKRGPLTYTLGWFRDNVTNNGNGGDDRETNNDVYAFDTTYTFDQGSRLNFLTIYRESGKDNNVGDTGSFLGNSTDVTDVQDKEYWIGFAGEGQVGNLFGGFTLIYEGGEVDAGEGTFDGGHDSLDREAYMISLEGTAKLDRSRVKLGWFYASGDDDSNDDKVENFNSIDTWTDSFGSLVIFDGLADDNSFAFAPYILDRGNNTLYLHYDYDLSEKATAGARYIWINTAEDIVKDSDLGHEFVVHAGYKITKNLKANWAASYFVGGDAWDELASDGDADDVIRTDFRVRYRF